MCCASVRPRRWRRSSKLGASFPACILALFTPQYDFAFSRVQRETGKSHHRMYDLHIHVRGNPRGADDRRHEYAKYIVLSTNLQPGTLE